MSPDYGMCQDFYFVNPKNKLIFTFMKISCLLYKEIKHFGYRHTHQSGDKYESSNKTTKNDNHPFERLTHIGRFRKPNLEQHQNSYLNFSMWSTLIMTDLYQLFRVDSVIIGLTLYSKNMIFHHLFSINGLDLSINMVRKLRILSQNG